jgi:hypothetical protein
VLSVAIRRLGDAKSARSLEHPFDFSHEPFCLMQIGVVAQHATQEHEKDETERIHPQIAQPVLSAGDVIHDARLVDLDVQSVGTKVHRVSSSGLDLADVPSAGGPSRVLRQLRRIGSANR